MLCRTVGRLDLAKHGGLAVLPPRSGDVILGNWGNPGGFHQGCVAIGEKRYFIEWIIKDEIGDQKVRWETVGGIWVWSDQNLTTKVVRLQR